MANDHDPTPKNIIGSSQHFVSFASKFASQYLSLGGPTSRLEERLTEVGTAWDLDVQVFATPTGVFVSAQEGEAAPITGLHRVNLGKPNLEGVIQLEELAHNVVQRDIPLNQVDHHLKKPAPPLTLSIYYLAAFLCGAGASYGQFALGIPALFSGLLTVIVAHMSGPVSSRWKLTGVFSDFLSSLLTISMAGVLAQFFQAPPHSFGLGPLIFLVPGLTLTNAISELAEHNFVSGTAKVMKGVLILLAIGVAYFLVLDLSKALGQGSLYTPETQTAVIHPLVKTFCIGTVLLGFSLIFQIPKRMIMASLAVGWTGWTVLHMSSNSNYFILGVFLPALCVGFLSLGFGRLFKVPSQTFSVPGILTLVPGLMAFSSIYSLGTENSDQAFAVILQVSLVASAIAFGLFSARIPFILLGKQNWFPQG